MPMRVRHMQSRLALTGGGQGQKGAVPAREELGRGGAVIFRVMPEWLTREAAKHSADSDTMDKRLKEHGEFAKQGFSSVWKQFNSE